MESSPLISIIIPVYNAEMTLHKSLDAIERQSYRKLEVVFIDDCSTDKSLLILQDFAMIARIEQQIQIKIIRHKKNRGVAVARNTGLEHATGEFIYYLDADDWMEDNTIELVVKEAVRRGADIVGFSWWLAFEENNRKMTQSCFRDPWEAIELMLRGKMRWNLWLFLVKRSIYEEYRVRFIPDMNMGEDMMVMIKLFAYAKRVVYLNRHLYYYSQSNANSLTKLYSKKHKDEVTAHVKEVESFLLKSKFSAHVEPLINFLKLNIKLPLLVSGNRRLYQEWLNWFPETNVFSMDNKILPLRTRMLQWSAAHKQFWFLDLYYHFIIRVVYGFFYK